MARLVPVAHDPFESEPAAQKAGGFERPQVSRPRLVPVEHDPFQAPDTDRAEALALAGGAPKLTPVEGSPLQADEKQAEVQSYEAQGGGILPSLERGARRVKQTLAAGGAALGDLLAPEEPTGPIGRFLREQVERDRAEVLGHEKEIQALPQHPTMQRAVEAANKSDGYLDAAGAFVREVASSPDTAGFLVDQAAELLPQVATFVLGAKGADKLLPLALKGLPRTAATMGGAGFISSIANSYGPNVAEAVQKGLDFDQAEARAALQSLAQGGIDAATAAVIPWRIGPSQVTNIPAQTLLQMVGGATGEIARKRVAGEEPQKGEVAAEALLEALGLPGEALSTLVVKSKPGTTVESQPVEPGPARQTTPAAEGPGRFSEPAIDEGMSSSTQPTPAAGTQSQTQGGAVSPQPLTPRKTIGRIPEQALAQSPLYDQFAKAKESPEQARETFAREIEGIPVWNARMVDTAFGEQAGQAVRARFGEENILAHEFWPVLAEIHQAGPAVADTRPADPGARDSLPARGHPQPVTAGPVAVVPETPIDAAAHQAATSPLNNLPEPTEAQKRAGNYPKGRLNLHGLEIAIENPAGSTRSGTAPDGKRWETPMANHYGYIKGTRGRDKDHLDVFLGPQAQNPELPVFVVDPQTGKFDEHKILLGFPHQRAARRGYLANYEPGWKGVGAVTRMTLPEFKTWIQGDTTRPVSGDVPVRVPTRKERLQARQQTAESAQAPGEMPPTGRADAWMPGSNYIGMVDQGTLRPEDLAATEAPPKTLQPIRREDILVPFLKALGTPLYQGRVKRKGVLGFYLPRKEAVRVKNKADIEVAAHELAHLIDDRVPAIRRSWRKDKALRDELKAISYDQSKTYEGFAEGVRLWMTQPAKLREVAPRFDAWMNRFAEAHEYGPALKQAREGMRKWFEQDALTRAASKIGSPKKPIHEALHSVFDGFRQAVSDDLDGIYRMERDLTGDIQPGGAYETARLSRGAHAMVEGALEIGAPVVREDGAFDFEGKSLREILDPVADDLDNFIRYAVGRSAQELMEQGREHLFTPAEVQAMLRLANPKFRAAFRAYQRWNTRVVDFAQAAGIINPETRKLWRRAQYLPFYRLNNAYGQRTAPSGVSGDWKGIARLTGGTDNLRDVLGNMIQNASYLMTAAARNLARQEAAQLANKVRGGGRFMVKIPKEAHPVRITKEEIIRILEEAGVTVEKAGPTLLLGDQTPVNLDQMRDLVTLFQFGQAPKGKNIVAVLEKGKPAYYEVADPLLMRSLTALDRPTKPWITRFLSGFRRVGQSSVTLSLDFMAANVARDTVMGGIISKHGFRPFVDSVRGMKSRITRDPAYREFIANGGGFSSHLLDETAFRKHLERWYTSKGINYRTVIDAPAKLLYFLETLADAFEMSTRLGEYQRAREAGASPRHAAYSAREVSTDFAMRGDSEVLGFFYDTVMFLKAGVNGMDRLYRGFAHDSNKLQIAAKTGLLALASMALYLINRDVPDYERLEDWDRDSNWHFFVPKAGGGHHHFRYPKLWEIGAVASIAERTTAGILEQAPKELAADFARIVLDQFKLDYVPQALEPLFEQYLNRNRFTGAPIETQSMEQLAPFARSKPHTATVLKELGLATRNLPRSVQVSPARTEALLRGYLNTWALYGLSLADAALYDDKPDMRVDQYPVFRRFYAADPAKRTKYETQFFDMLREATELRRTLREMDKINRPDIADELERKPRLREYGQLNRTSKDLQAINREVRQAYIDDGLSPAQKRRVLDGLTLEKNQLLEAVVKDIEVQRAGN